MIMLLYQFIGDINLRKTFQIIIYNIYYCKGDDTTNKLLENRDGL